MNRLVVFLAAFVILSQGLAAQENGPGGAVQEEMKSTLYRGRLPEVYPFKYNGTYFWSSPEFRKGSVMYNGKRYNNVYLNVDAAAMDLLVRSTPSSAAAAVYRNQVAWFSMDGTEFVNLRYLGYQEAPEGYFQVVRDGTVPLLIQVTKVLQARTGNHNGDDIGYKDPDYDPDVVNYFEFRQGFYTIQEGKVQKLRKRAFNRMARQNAPAGGNVLASARDEWHPAPVQDGSLPEPVFTGTGIGLPDNYFASQEQDTTRVEYATNALTATYRNKIYVIGEAGKGGSRATVTGTVTDVETALPLPGVLVYDEKTSTYVRTDSRGRYSITLPVGENTLNFSADSKEELALMLQVHSNGSLDVVMTEKVTALKAAIVSASSMEKHRSTSMGVETVSMTTMNKIPSAFGEGDVLKAVLTLPGVKSVGEASSGFNVRGGSADQNLILFNESTIYNPSHMFGIFSSFNPDVVDEVELYKSSIPAEYGGRISSVMEVKSKEGDPQKIKGSLGIGILTSRAHLEGPLAKGKTTFSIGGRITYSDWMLKLLPENSAYGGGKAGFADANVGITHRFNANNTLQAYGYFATDRFSFSGDTTFRYTNANASLIFTHKADDGSSLRLSAGYDHFFNRLGAHNWEQGAYDMDTYIRQAFLKAIRRRPLGEKHTLSYGVHLLGYGLDPGILNPYGEHSQIVARRLDREYGVEPSVFVSDVWKATDQFSLDGGVRLSTFLAAASKQFYAGPEFRLSAKYSPLENLSFKAGVNTMRQYIHLISNTTSISPMDTWKLSDDKIKPTTGMQVAAGGYWTSLGTGIDFSLEGYWKQMENCLDYKPGAVLSMNPNLAEDLVPVRGKAWGVEVMAKKTTGSLTGWISYSYSRTHYQEMQDRGNETINRGEWYNAPYDKPHEVKLVANWAITHRYSLSVNLDYSTGRPVTVPVGKYYYAGTYRLAYSDRNSYRIPDYFRMDVAVNIDPGHYLKALAHASITIGVYNVTGRKNPYSVFFRTDTAGQVKGYMLSVFASQIPYINLNILF